MSNRIVDISAIDKLSRLITLAKEENLALSMDFLGCASEPVWIVQVFDLQERLVVSVRDLLLGDAIDRVYDNLFAKDWGSIS
jgi:hypothetical protein